MCTACWKAADGVSHNQPTEFSASNSQAPQIGATTVNQGFFIYFRQPIVGLDVAKIVLEESKKLENLMAISGGIEQLGKVVEASGSAAVQKPMSGANTEFRGF